VLKAQCIPLSVGFPFVQIVGTLLPDCTSPHHRIRICYQSEGPASVYANISTHPVSPYIEACSKQTVLHVGVVFRYQRCLCQKADALGVGGVAQDRLTSNFN
jgi:hypothetical protein